MKLNDLKKYFERLKVEYSISYEFGSSNCLDDISKTEEKFDLVFPLQIKEFYINYDGMYVKDPAFEVYPLDKLRKIKDYLIFAKFNNEFEVAFDISRINRADQWNIVNIENGFCVTLTMASFWSNKIPAWIIRERKIWDKEV